MPKTEIPELLEKLNMAPSKKLGQNFLIEQNLIDYIVRSVHPDKGESVLEIGPGTGVLTQRLVEAGVNLTAVEFDHRLAGYIRETYGVLDNCHLEEGDACKVDYDKLMGSVPYRCIANLPYAISSIFISKLLETDNPPTRFFVMLQKEMADRLGAKPRTKSYGSLSVRIQAVYNVRNAKKVSRTCFYPPPDVDSVLMDAQKKDSEIPPKKVRIALSEVSKTAFAQRRKQCLKLLGARYDKAFIAQSFEELGISSTARAEEITVEQFIQLTEKILNKGD